MTAMQAGPATARVKRRLKTYQFFSAIISSPALLYHVSQSFFSAPKQKKKKKAPILRSSAPLLYAFPQHTPRSVQKISDLVAPAWYRNLGSRHNTAT